MISSAIWFAGAALNAVFAVKSDDPNFVLFHALLMTIAVFLAVLQLPKKGTK